MAKEEVTLIHYQEIALKGRNRPLFERQLAANLQLLLRRWGEKVLPPQWEYGRFFFPAVFRAETEKALAQIFGVSSVARAEVVSWQEDEIQAALRRRALKEWPRLRKKTFALRVKRAVKNFPLTSLEAERKWGGWVKQALGLKVDLENPELLLEVEIVSERVFVLGQRIKGPGGLPAGSSTRVLQLFSGGVDSALAAYLLGRRGCKVDLLHFHALPNNQAVLETKIYPLAQFLSCFFPGLNLTVVPYRDFYWSVMQLPSSLADQEVVVFRRFMARVAQEFARRRRIKVLASGDSLGQVASQTFSNLAAVDEVLQMPLWRPLIALGKDEIEARGREIGLAELAHQPYKDCCSLIARHPATKARPQKIVAIEEKLQLPDLLQQTLAGAETWPIFPSPRQERNLLK